MQEPNADFHLVAKRMMYDFRVFNAEICDLPSDAEENKNPSRSPSPSRSHSPSPKWCDSKCSDFDADDLDIDSFLDSPVKKGY